MGTTADRSFSLRGKSYDNPLVTEHAVLANDFGAGNVALQIGRPSGANFCKIVDIVIDNVTEVFNSVTTGARVDIGTAADPNRYCNFETGDVAVGGSATLSDDADAISASANGTNLIDLATEAIQEIEADFVAPTGGTPTGIADAKIILAWWG